MTRDIARPYTHHCKLNNSPSNIIWQWASIYKYTSKLIDPGLTYSKCNLRYLYQCRLFDGITMKAITYFLFLILFTTIINCFSKTIVVFETFTQQERHSSPTWCKKLRHTWDYWQFMEVGLYYTHNFIYYQDSWDRKRIITRNSFSKMIKNMKRTIIPPYARLEVFPIASTIT